MIIFSCCSEWKLKLNCGEKRAVREFVVETLLHVVVGKRASGEKSLNSIKDSRLFIYIAQCAVIVYIHHMIDLSRFLRKHFSMFNLSRIFRLVSRIQPKSSSWFCIILFARCRRVESVTILRLSMETFPNQLGYKNSPRTVLYRKQIS